MYFCETKCFIQLSCNSLVCLTNHNAAGCQYCKKDEITVNHPDSDHSNQDQSQNQIKSYLVEKAMQQQWLQQRLKLQQLYLEQKKQQHNQVEISDVTKQLSQPEVTDEPNELEDTDTEPTPLPPQITEIPNKSFMSIFPWVLFPESTTVPDLPAFQTTEKSSLLDISDDTVILRPLIKKPTEIRCPFAVQQLEVIEPLIVIPKKATTQPPQIITEELMTDESPSLTTIPREIINGNILEDLITLPPVSPTEETVVLMPVTKPAQTICEIAIQEALAAQKNEIEMMNISKNIIPSTVAMPIELIPDQAIITIESTNQSNIINTSLTNCSDGKCYISLVPTIYTYPGYKIVYGPGAGSPCLITNDSTSIEIPCENNEEIIKLISESITGQLQAQHQANLAMLSKQHQQHIQLGIAGEQLGLTTVSHQGSQTQQQINGLHLQKILKVPQLLSTLAQTAYAIPGQNNGHGEFYVQNQPGEFQIESGGEQSNYYSKHQNLRDTTTIANEKNNRIYSNKKTINDILGSLSGHIVNGVQLGINGAQQAQQMLLNNAISAGIKGQAQSHRTFAANIGGKINNHLVGILANGKLL